MAKQIKAPAYQWYPKDILTSVRVAALSDMGELWYRRALDWCWLNGDLPADPETLARVIGRGCTVEGAASILHMFTPHKKDATKIVHDRQQKERRKQAENRLQKTKAGLASAAKRRKQKELDEQKRSTNGATAVELPYQRKGNPSSSSPNSSIDSSKEESNLETPPKATGKKGTRLPDTFLLTAEMRSWAAERKPDVDLVLETEKFCNHFRSAPGTKGTKLDWLLTWKNWILNAKGTHGTNTTNRGHSEREKSAERGFNAVAAINELRRQAAEEQALSGRGNGSDPPHTLAIESA